MGYTSAALSSLLTHAHVLQQDLNSWRQAQLSEERPVCRGLLTDYTERLGESRVSAAISDTLAEVVASHTDLGTSGCKQWLQPAEPESVQLATSTSGVSEPVCD